MMHRAWSSIVEVPYCFSRSYVKFQGHSALKIVEFDPNWAFPDSNSSLNSPMAMKCCTKLETAKERCPVVFHGHPSNFKVTWDKTSPILTQIGRFRTIGRSQLSNPSDLPCSPWQPQSTNRLPHFKQQYKLQGIMKPGARPTNDISIEFESRPKYAVLWFKMNSIKHNDILHTARQYNCCGVCKVSSWSVKYTLN